MKSVMERRCSMFLLLAALAWSAGAHSACGPGLNTPGFTLPRGDVALLYGQPLELLCLLDLTHELASGHNASSLIFYRGEDPVEPQYMTILNRTALRLQIPIPAMSDSMYYCKLQRSGEAVAVCLNHVTVGTPLREVDNFTCLSLNWDNLTCTWRPERNYLKTQYSLTFRLPGRSSRAVYSCPNITMETDTGEYSCFWDLSTSPLYRQPYPNYKFNLTGSNKFNSISQDLNFNHYAHVKPSRPEKLKILSKSAHSVLLSWAIPYPMVNFPPGLLHRVMYRSDANDSWSTANTGALPPKASTHTFNVSGLSYAYRHYSVRVFIRSEKAVGEEFWSDFAAVTFRTSGEPPARPPDIDEGGFEVTPLTKLNASQTDPTHRTVSVYWKQLHVLEENGEDFLYKVEVYTERLKLAVASAQSKKGYITYRNLPLKPLEFFVTASNKEGESPSKARLVVPAQNETLAEPSFFTKAALGNGTYELSWKHPKENMSAVESYTIFWCDNSRDRPYQCEGRLEWERVSSNETSRVITVAEDKIYQFAISANGQGTSSGMVWASCTIIPNKAVEKIKEISRYQVGSTFIEVGWNLECPDNMGVIKSYRVFYCPIKGLHDKNCMEPVRDITVNASSTPDTRVNITNLWPYTTYAIQVAIIARHEIGPQSDPVEGVTLEGAPEPPTYLSITDLSATSLLLSWNPPRRFNGVLQFYNVYFGADGLDWKSVKVDKSMNITEVLLTDLKSYTNYTVYVVACTVACSLPSEKLLVRTAISRAGPVSQPTVSIRDNQHHLMWHPPAEPGGTLDLYEVRVLKVGKDDNNTIQYNTTAREMVIPEPVCQEQGVLTYLYSVRAVNYDASVDHGAAAYSHRVVAKTRSPEDTEIYVYKGPWGPFAENTCTPGTSKGLLLSVCIIVAIIAGVILFYVGKLSWGKIENMRTIKAVMPEGLVLEQEKDSKYSNWNTPLPWHGKEGDKQSPVAPADEVSLLGPPAAPPSSPGARDTSGFSATTTSTSLSGGSSRRAPSPEWPYSAVGLAQVDSVSDSDVTPTNTENPYVTCAPEIPKRIVDYVSNGYVQASLMDSGAPKDMRTLAACTETVPVLPPTYVMTAPESSPYRPAGLGPVSSPYVTVDDPRITGILLSQPCPGVVEMNANFSGYVKHDDMMFNTVPSAGSSQALPVPVTPARPVSKRTSAPPLIISKLAGEDKRISLHADPALSPDYCRFGWKEADSWQGPPPLASPLLACLGKEDYELSPEDLMEEESPPLAPAAPSHYLPLSPQTLQS